MLFSVHHHFMASLGSNNFVLSLKVWIQKTDATSETKVGRKLLRFPPTRLKYIESSKNNNTKENK